MNFNPFFLIQRIWKGRRTPLLLASAFLVMFIWWIGPKLPFPFSNAVFRGFLTAIIMGGVFGFIRWRDRRKDKGSEELMEAMAEPDDSDVLKRKFKAAVKTLKSSQGRNRKGLLELPWYIIIGPPGSGKTTLLRNAGLTFPLEGDEAAMAVRGVGGTRDCDWWFANEAVLLDTAGRYTTQDSDETADRKGWLAFLDLLKKRRRKRPINGILVAIGADTLLSSSRDELSLHAATIRKRVLELYSHLGGRYPIYVTVTKTDLIAGFNAFFDDLSASEREQVWGYTQQVIKAEGETANVEAIFDGEFELLLRRLSERTLERLRDETDPDRRALIVAFPEQLARAREQLRLLVTQGFMPNAYQEPLLLRGLYLTSGTQEGSPIDRMMGGVSRALGTAQTRLLPITSTGRSYFIKDVLGKVAFPEQDLLGLGYREVQRKRRIQLGAYAGIAATAGLALVVWTYAYIQEKAYVANAAERLEAYQNTVPGYPDINFEYEFDRQARDVILRLDALKKARDDIALADPKSPLIGLPGDQALLKSIDDAYHEQLQKSLAPLVKTSLRQRLRSRDDLIQQVAAFNVYEVNLLSTFLRNYAAMSDPRKRLKNETARQDFINTVLFDLELRNSAFRQALQPHIEAWVNQPRGIRGIEIDVETLSGAQAILGTGGDGLGPVRAAYDDWLFENVRNVTSSNKGIPGIVDQVGQDASDVFRRRSGRPLNEAIPFIFTRAGFEKFFDTEIDAIIERVDEDDWVYGEDAIDNSIATNARMRTALTERYVGNYIQFWKDFLNDVTIEQINRDIVLRKMSRQPSPLKDLLRIVVTNTTLGMGEESPAASGGLNFAGIKLTNPNQAGPEVAAEMPPEERVTRSFKDLSRLFGTDDKPGPIDAIVLDIRTLANAAAADGQGSVGDADGARSALEIVARDLETADLGFEKFFREIVGSADESRTEGVAARLAQKYRQEVLPVCLATTSRRYPFVRGETREVGLRDMENVFGPNGLITRFVDEDLGRFIDRSRGGWTWKEDIEGLAAGSPSIKQFQKADLIRRAFFVDGVVDLEFNATPIRLGEDTKRAVFIMGDVRMEYFGQNLKTVRGFSWPGGDARTELYLKNTDKKVNAPAGSWTAFRLLDAATETTPLPGGTSMIMSVGAPSEALTMRIETDSIDNPLTTFSNWRNFRCPAQLW